MRGRGLAAVVAAAVLAPILAGAQPPESLERATRLDAEVYQLYHQGKYAEAVSRARESLALREQALGADHPDLSISLANLAALLQETGDHATARQLYERALSIDERRLGPDHPDVAVDLNNLAALLGAMGEYAVARRLYERALGINERSLGPRHPTVGASLNNLAGLLEAQGAYAAARPLYERALHITEAALGSSLPAVAIRLNNLAALLWAQGETTDAQPLYERALRISESALGPTHPDVAVRLNNLAMLLKAQGEYAKARPLYERALRIDEARLGPDHPGVAVDLNNLAGLLREMGDDVAARPLYERALSINERALGPDHPTVGASLNNLAVLLKATGDLAGARPLYARALSINTQILGPAHPTVGIGRANLAALLWAQGDHAGARSAYERARRVALAVSAANPDLDDRGRRGLLRPTLSSLRDHATLLAEIARDPRRDPTAPAAAEAFVVAEQARAGAAQAALARAGARVAAARAETADLARELQQLRERLDAARKQLVAEYGRPPERRDPSRLASARQSAQQIERDLLAAARRLDAAFPEYARLASPEPIDVASTGRLLGPDEALLSFLALEDRVLAWLVRAGRPVVYRDVHFGRANLAALVRRVRESLDQSANPGLAATQLIPFDVTGAHELYRVLIGPIARDLRGIRHVIVVPDDALLPVPFGVLVTSSGGEPYATLAEAARRGTPAGPLELAAYPKLPWLARQYAITVLPSATSLRALRQTPRARRADVEPFLGFGDPVLGGGGGPRGGAMVPAHGDGLEAIRRMSPLPGTRDELLAVARALGAEPAHTVFLGARATKPQVMALDAAGRLARTRVLSFATHGLLAGEIGANQPALVLTPPAQASDQDDGLLSLDDIVRLHLGAADWVVLSACNTGAADGSGEGLSGFARAFFFAGAPTLLVSHWSVDDHATAALMTQVFERYAKDPKIARAEALRQAMLALMAQAQGPTAYFAHPFAWAPFFLVGEGR